MRDLELQTNLSCLFANIRDDRFTKKKMCNTNFAYDHAPICIIHSPYRDLFNKIYNIQVVFCLSLFFFTVNHVALGNKHPWVDNRYLLFVFGFVR